MLHNISKEEFLQKYPNTKMISDETNKLLSEGTKLNWQDPAYRKKCSSYTKENGNVGGKYLKGKPKSEHMKKGIKEFSNSEIGRQIRSNNFSKSVKILWNDEEYIKRRRIAGRNQALKNIENGNFGHKIYKYNDINFRSTWEVRVAKWLDENNIEYEYEKHRFNYIDYEGIERIYIPDFYIKNYNIFIEVKPECFINDVTNLKIKAVYNKGYIINYFSDIKNLSNLQNLLTPVSN